MMNTICVSVDELYKLVSEMKNDGMYSVEISIIDDPDGNFVCFNASTKDFPEEGIDYEDLDELILS